eukprot:g4283.t1
MFESLVASLLQKYLGAYVDGIDTSKLKVGYGAVELKNLKLKPEALEDAGLPVLVRSGYIGNVKLNVPWTNLMGRPTIIEVEDVYAIVAPNAELNFDQKVAVQRELKRKLTLLAQRELDQATALAALAAEKEGGNKSPTRKKKGFAARMLTRVIDNLQLFIRRIHIRYEDRSSLSGKAFVIGVCLGELKVQSQNSVGSTVMEGRSADGPEGLLYKLLSAKDFAVYMNANMLNFATKDSENMYKLTSQMSFIFPGCANASKIAENTAALEASRLCDANTLENTQPGTFFVIPPVGGNIRLALNDTKTLSKKQFPLLSIHASFDPLEFALSRQQYSAFLAAVDSLSNFKAYARYRQHRPPVGTRPNCSTGARAWWKYAIEAKLIDVRERAEKISWLRLIRLVQAKSQYTAAFGRQLAREAVCGKSSGWLSGGSKLTSSELQGTAASDKLKLDELEEWLKLDELVVFRDAARRERAHEAEMAAKRKAVEQASNPRGVRRFMKWAWGSTTSDKKEEAKLEAELESAEEDWKKLQESFDYDEAPIWETLSEKDVQLRFELQQTSSTLHMLGEKRNPLLEISITELLVKGELRKAFVSAQLQVGDVQGVDHFTKDTLYPLVLSRETDVEKNSLSHRDRPLLFATVELPPLDRSSSLRVRITMQPLRLIAGIPLPVRLMKWLAIQPVNLEAVKKLLIARVAALRQASKNSITDILESHKTLDMDINMGIGTIVLPQDPTKEDTLLMVADLGVFTARSQVRSNVKAATNKTALKEDEKRPEMYDKILVRLTDINLRLGVRGQQGVDTGLALGTSNLTNISQTKHLALLQPCTVKSTVQIAIAANSDPSQASIIAHTVMTPLAFDITSTKYRQLLSLMSSVVAALPKRSPEELARDATRLERQRALRAKWRARQQAILEENLRNARDGTHAGKATPMSPLSKVEKNETQLFDLEKAETENRQKLQDRAVDDAELSGEALALLQKKVNLEASFIVSALRLTISDDKLGPLIIWENVDSECFVRIRSFDMQVKVRMKDYRIEDGVSSASLPGEQKALNLCSAYSAANSGDSGDMLTLKMNIYQPMASDYPSTAADVTLSCTFSGLVINLRRETMAALIIFAAEGLMAASGDIEAAREKGISGAAGGDDLHNKDFSSEDNWDPWSSAGIGISSSEMKFGKSHNSRELARKDAVKKRQVRLARSGAWIETASLKVDFYVTELALTLAVRDGPVARFGVKGMHGSLIQREASLEVHSGIEAVVVEDLTPLGIELYRNVISGGVHTRQKDSQSVNKKSVLSVNLLQCDERSQRWQGFKLGLDVKAESLRVVFLMRFVREIQLWATSGPVHHALERAAEVKLLRNAINDARKAAMAAKTAAREGGYQAAQAVAKTVMEDPHASLRAAQRASKGDLNSASLPWFNVSLHDFSLVLPLSSLSEQGFRLTLGAVTLTNSRKSAGVPSLLGAVSYGYSNATTQSTRQSLARVRAQIDNFRVYSILRCSAVCESKKSTTVAATNTDGGQNKNVKSGYSHREQSMLASSSFHFGVQVEDVLKIDVSFSSIRMAVSQRQYSAALLVPLCNLSELSEVLNEEGNKKHKLSTERETLTVEKVVSLDEKDNIEPPAVPSYIEEESVEVRAVSGRPMKGKEKHNVLELFRFRFKMGGASLILLRGNGGFAPTPEGDAAMTHAVAFGEGETTDSNLNSNAALSAIKVGNLEIGVNFGTAAIGGGFCTAISASIGTVVVRDCRPSSVVAPAFRNVVLLQCVAGLEKSVDNSRSNIDDNEMNTGSSSFSFQSNNRSPVHLTAIMMPASEDGAESNNLVSQELDGKLSIGRLRLTASGLIPELMYWFAVGSSTASSQHTAHRRRSRRRRYLRDKSKTLHTAVADTTVANTRRNGHFKKDKASLTRTKFHFHMHKIDVCLIEDESSAGQSTKSLLFGAVGLDAVINTLPVPAQLFSTGVPPMDIDLVVVVRSFRGCHGIQGAALTAPRLATPTDFLQPSSLRFSAGLENSESGGNLRIRFQMKKIKFRLGYKDAILLNKCMANLSVVLASGEKRKKVKGRVGKRLKLRVGKKLARAKNMLIQATGVSATSPTSKSYSSSRFSPSSGVDINDDSELALSGGEDLDGSGLDENNHMTKIKERTRLVDDSIVVATSSEDKVAQEFMIPSTERHKKAKRTMTLSASFILPAIVIDVVNDFGAIEMALLQLSILDATASASGVFETGDFTSEFHCKVVASYYNEALSLWEPLLEPWMFRTTLIVNPITSQPKQLADIDSGKTLPEHLPADINIVVESLNKKGHSSNIKLNLTSAFLVTMLQSLTMINGGLHKKHSESKRNVAKMEAKFCESLLQYIYDSVDAVKAEDDLEIDDICYALSNDAVVSAHLLKNIGKDSTAALQKDPISFLAVALQDDTRFQEALSEGFDIEIDGTIAGEKKNVIGAFRVSRELLSNFCHSVYNKRNDGYFVQFDNETGVDLVYCLASDEVKQVPNESSIISVGCEGPGVGNAGKTPAGRQAYIRRWIVKPDASKSRRPSDIKSGVGSHDNTWWLTAPAGESMRMAIPANVSPPTEGTAGIAPQPRRDLAVTFAPPRKNGNEEKESKYNSFSNWAPAVFCIDETDSVRVDMEQRLLLLAFDPLASLPDSYNCYVNVRVFVPSSCENDSPVNRSRHGGYTGRPIKASLPGRTMVHAGSLANVRLGSCLNIQIVRKVTEKVLINARLPLSEIVGLDGNDAKPKEFSFGADGVGSLVHMRASRTACNVTRAFSGEKGRSTTLLPPSGLYGCAQQSVACGDLRHQVVCDVRARDGRKTVRLRSMLSIINCSSDCAFELTYLEMNDDNCSRAVLRKVVLLPGCTEFVPLPLLGSRKDSPNPGEEDGFDSIGISKYQCAVQLHPLGLNYLSVSKPAAVCPLARGHLLKDLQKLHFKADSAGKDDFYVHTELVSSQLHKEDDRNTSCDWLLLPPFRVINLLPTDMHWRLIKVRGESGEVLASGSLLPGDEKGVHAVPVETKNLFLQLSLSPVSSSYESLSWSTPVSVTKGGKTSFRMVSTRKSPALKISVHADRNVLRQMNGKDGVGRAALVLRCFVPYWIANRTGLSLLYHPSPSSGMPASTLGICPSEDVEKLLSNECDVTSVTLIDIAMGVKEMKKVAKSSTKRDGTSNAQAHTLHGQLAIRMKDAPPAAWSKVFSIAEIEPAAGALELIGASGDRRQYELIARAKSAPGCFGFYTRVIEVMPRYSLVNCTSRSLVVMQHNVYTKGDFVKILPRAEIPFHWPDRSQPEKLCIQPDGQDWRPSAAFRLSNSGQTLVRLRHSRKLQAGEMEEFLSCNVIVKEGLVVVEFREICPKELPFRIDNMCTTASIFVQQKGAQMSSGFTVTPLTRRWWTWEEPLLQRKLLIQLQGLFTTKDDKIDEVALSHGVTIAPQEVNEDKIVTIRGNRLTVRLLCKMDGRTMVLKITDFPVTHTAETSQSKREQFSAFSERHSLLAQRVAAERWERIHFALKNTNHNLLFIKTITENVVKDIEDQINSGLSDEVGDGRGGLYLEIVELRGALFEAENLHGGEKDVGEVLGSLFTGGGLTTTWEGWLVASCGEAELKTPKKIFRGDGSQFGMFFGISGTLPCRNGGAIVGIKLFRKGEGVFSSDSVIAEMSFPVSVITSVNGSGYGSDACDYWWPLRAKTGKAR